MKRSTSAKVSSSEGDLANWLALLEARHPRGAAVKVAVEKVLDAAVGRAEVTGKQARFLAVAFQQVVGDGEEFAAVAVEAAGLAGRRKLEIDVKLQARACRLRFLGWLGQSREVEWAHEWILLIRLEKIVSAQEFTTDPGQDEPAADGTHEKAPRIGPAGPVLLRLAQSAVKAPKTK